MTAIDRSTSSIRSTNPLPKTLIPRIPCEWSPITPRLPERGIFKSYETNDLEQQLPYELANIHMPFASDDAKEARQTFLEKRKRPFRGKWLAASRRR